MDDTRRNMELIRKVYEVGFSAGDVDIMDEAFAPNYVCRFPGLPPIIGFAACKAAIGAFLTAFPARYTVEHLLGEGDRVVCRWSAVGTHAGPFTDLTDPGRVYPPTGRPVTFSATDIYRFENGKVAEEWNSIEEYGLLFQIGALVRPG
ncbi:ester cyclase [Roseococcus thiosulfatophilus]|uniref:ester cyclase n=1 Tax=Roseococcus thiosulfatophilus TaxID=35813 RepID=UPI001A8C3098|nr:ester cyclase [Roseococcus thiosulfatophilus]